MGHFYCLGLYLSEGSQQFLSACDNKSNKYAYNCTAAPVQCGYFLFRLCADATCKHSRVPLQNPPLPRFNLMPATSLFIIRRAHNPAKSFSLLCQNKVSLTLQACRTNFLDPTDAEVLFNSQNVPESDLCYKTVRWNFLFTGSLPCSPASLA